MKIPNREHWLDVHTRELVRRQFPINRLQGDKNAPLFIVAPPPKAEEVAENLAWCGPTAQVFFEFLAAVCPLRPSSFLIMPSAFKEQTTKNFRAADALFGQEIVAAAARESQIRGFACIGSDAFKSYFGFGKKPSMPMLVGNVMRLANVGNKPVIVFPDLEPLCFEAPNGQRFTRREVAQALGLKRETLNLLEKKKAFEKLYSLWPHQKASQEPSE